MLSELSQGDQIALGVFFLLWVAYTGLADHTKIFGRSLSSVMSVHRHSWMRQMCDRENRVADTSLVGFLMRSVSFFASASILVLGGLVALMGSGDRAFQIYQDMPFAAHGTTLDGFEIKLVVLALVFIYAFFQFTWSLRQFNYCCILIGSAPGINADSQDKEEYSRHAARLQTLAANSFNRGLRAYYFALALLLWFVRDWALVSAALLVVGIMYRREFRSKSRALLYAGLSRTLP